MNRVPCASPRRKSAAPSGLLFQPSRRDSWDGSDPPSGASSGLVHRTSSRAARGVPKRGVAPVPPFIPAPYTRGPGIGREPQQEERDGGNRLCYTASLNFVT